MPRTYWQEVDGEGFANPYNFVPLLGAPKRGPVVRGGVSGYLECEGVLKTPLCLPDSEGNPPQKNKHRTLPFFNVGGSPRVPGSEIRGVVRSAFEVLDKGCVSVVDADGVLSSRSPKPLLPGLLRYKNRKWELVEADMVDSECDDPGLLITDEQLDAERVWVTLESWNEQASDPNSPLEYRTFRFSAKGYGDDYVSQDDGKIRLALEGYRRTWDAYCGDEGFPSANLEGSVVPENPQEWTEETGGPWYPVFYREVGGRIYLAPAQISRLTYRNTLGSLLPEEYRSCEESGRVCSVCGLFGIVGDRNSGGEAISVPSRIRFSDGSFLEGWHLSGKKTLKELSSPKISSVEFYTYRPDNSRSWNYDFSADGNTGRIFGGNRALLLRGRKQYLHHPDFRWEDATVEGEEEKTERNITTTFMEEKAVFRFRVYFDHVTDDELKKIAWVLCLGENDKDGNRLYKMGHGKPFGFGSVKIWIREGMRREITDEGEYIIEPIDIPDLVEDCPFIEDDLYKDFMQITRFDLMKGLKISYPVADAEPGRAHGNKSKNAESSHQWFVGNRSIGEGASAMSWSVRNVLPTMSLTRTEKGARALLLPKLSKSIPERKFYPIKQNGHDDDSRALRNDANARKGGAHGNDGAGKLRD